MANTQMVSNWTPVPDGEEDAHCCMRYLVGTDPTVVANRVAFIEKSPRVQLNDGTWEYGPKGTGGNNQDATFEQQGIYGYYQPSRDWCDQRLRELGYTLQEDTTA